MKAPGTAPILKTLTALLMGAWMSHQPAQAVDVVITDSSGNTYMRMFQNMPSFATLLTPDKVRAEAQSWGVKGGVLDGQDFSSLPDNNLNPNGLTTGYTYLGQFIDHDITRDERADLKTYATPGSVVNFRTPFLDLDSLYGAGPVLSPQLYVTTGNKIKFLVPEMTNAFQLAIDGGARFDVPRDAGGVAIIGDPRNDENVIVSQMHVAMMMFHNAVVDSLATQPAYVNASAQTVFNDARKIVIWHYQWVVLHDYLPHVTVAATLNDVLQNGVKFYHPELPGNSATLPDGTVLPKLPVEFAVAAFRFGHSQVRPTYRVNRTKSVSVDGLPATPSFNARVFNATILSSESNPNDLRGGKKGARRFVEWQNFFNFNDGSPAPELGQAIDTKLSAPLFELPGAGPNGPATALPSDGVQSLASRNLTRHVNFRIPSGQDIARAMNIAPLPAAATAIFAPQPGQILTMNTATPLWLYVLREAETTTEGDFGGRLGLVGSRIVDEVFVSLLRTDPTSYLSVQPGWTPTLPSATAGTFNMTDLLKFAGVVHRLK